MDPRQAEVVIQFAKLLEVLSDPEGLKRTVEETKEVTKKYQEVLGSLSTKEEADKYLAKALKKLEDADKIIEDEKTAHNLQMESDKRDVSNMKIELQDSIKKVNQAMIDASNKLSLAQSMEKSAKSKLDEVFLREEEVRKKSAELSGKESELKDKAEKLKQLIGG